MREFLDAEMVAIVLLTLSLLGTSRLGTCIRLLALEGIVLGALPFLALSGGFSIRAVLLSVGIVALKGGVFPWLLRRAMRDANVRREVEPFLGFAASILTGVVLLGVAFGIAARLPAAPASGSLLVAPVAFFNILAGLLVIVTRRKALTQVIGYLLLENGIFVFGIAFAGEQPLLIELGILLDVFVAVFVMGIMIFHISREFDHIDADRLTALRDWTRRWRRG